MLQPLHFFTAKMPHNVRRLPTYRSEETSEQRELAPERRYVQPADFFSTDLVFFRLASERSERRGNC
jgi:hypothetical protein